MLLFRGASTALARVPRAGRRSPSHASLFRVGYHLWPSQARASSTRNAAHVLGLPADRPAGGSARARHLRSYCALRARAHAPARPARRRAGAPPRAPRARTTRRSWRSGSAAAPRAAAIIAVSGHIGSIEVFAGAYARSGVPTYGLADDTAFPELFELLNRPRARWGVTIIPWRHLRDIFRVMRRPCALGMVVDWGYRPDDLPVRLFGRVDDAAGRAGHARGSDRRRHRARRRPPRARRPLPTRGCTTPIEVADGSPASLAAATQAIADALEVMVAGRARAVAHVQADVAGDGGRVGRAGGARAWHGAHGVSGAAPADVAAMPTRSRPLRRLAFRLLDLGLAIAQRLPDRPVYRVAYARRRRRLAGSCPRGERSCARNLARVCGWLVAHEHGEPAVQRGRPGSAGARRARPRHVRALGRVVRRVGARAPLRRRRAPRAHQCALDPRGRRPGARAAGPGERRGIQLAMHFGSVDLAGLYAHAHAGRARDRRPWSTSPIPIARAYFERVRGALGVDARAHRRAPPRASPTRSRAASWSGSSPIGSSAGRGHAVELFGATARLPLGPAVLSVQTGAPRLAPGRRADRARATGSATPCAIAPAPGRRAGASATRSILDAGGARVRAHRRARAGAVVDTVLPDLGRQDGERPA